MKKRFWQRFTRPTKTKEAQQTGKKPSKPYFEDAGTFASDMVSQLSASRDRSQKLVMVLGACVVALSLALIVMAATQRSNVLVIHRDDNGVVWAAWAANSHYVSTTQPELRSELTRYVITRESYHYDEFNFQYKMMGILSSDPVFKAFQSAQSATQTTSSLNTLGQTGTRTVSVENIMFIDSADDKRTAGLAGTPHQNLAQIYYTVTTHAQNAPDVKTPYIATVSWKYEGVPSNPEYQAYDWSGFTIMRYDRVQATTLGDNSNA